MSYRNKIRKEYFNKINYIRKSCKWIFNMNFSPVIPLNLYVYWHSKTLPPLIHENYKKLVNDHPRFNHYLFDENMARDFIKENFENDVLNAYDSLIPSAFKCDLWRYCILYKNGGIYLDIKYKCVNDFKLIALTNREFFVRDLVSSGEGIYNALLVCMPNNNVLLNAINTIVKNVQNKYYGESGLFPTGPMLLKSLFPKNFMFSNMQLQHTLHNYQGLDIFCIEFKKNIALEIFKEYRYEQRKHVSKHHSEYWNERNIYK